MTNDYDNLKIIGELSSDTVLIIKLSNNKGLIGSMANIFDNTTKVQGGYI